MGGLQFFMQAAASPSLSEVANVIRAAQFFSPKPRSYSAPLLSGRNTLRKLFGLVSYPLQLFSGFNGVILAG